MSLNDKMSYTLIQIRGMAWLVYVKHMRETCFGLIKDHLLQMKLPVNIGEVSFFLFFFFVYNHIVLHHHSYPINCSKKKNQMKDIKIRMDGKEVLISACHLFRWTKMKTAPPFCCPATTRDSQSLNSKVAFDGVVFSPLPQNHYRQMEETNNYVYFHKTVTKEKIITAQQ